MKTIQEYLKIVDDVIANGEFKDNWESLSKWETPQWYKKGRFGLFIHWGVYSYPSYGSEWYPRLMYNKLHKCCKHKKEAYGDSFEYRQLVEKFNPEKFNADEWLSIIKESGAKYIMPVGEHHDGVKMYDSELNRWNMMKLRGRDYIAELHEACDKQDIGFLISNHRAEHYWFLNFARKYYPDSEVVKNEEYRDLYGPAFLPESKNAERTDKEIHATKEWLEDWLASACEMIDKNKPLAVYFDWWIHKLEFKPYVKKFLAYYYNRALEWGKEVTVFYKWGAIMNGCATFDVERGQSDTLLPELWQNDTSIAKNSWGYTENNEFKKPEDLIRNMIEVVSKNGCYMLNIGPKPDGTICQEEAAVLKTIGSWLKVNGEAIYDVLPSELGFGEIKKQKNGAFKENKVYNKKDFCFTYKTGAFYVFPMSKKAGNKLVIKKLRHSNENGIRYTIKNVSILGMENKVSFTQDEKALTINIGGALNSDMPYCIKVEVD